MKKIENTVYDYREDFKRVETIFVEEKLTEEDLEEGLFPENYEIKVCLTTHACERMYDTDDRGAEWEEVENLLLVAGDRLLQLKNGSKFTVFTKDSFFAIVGNTHYQDGKLVLIISTIITIEKDGKKKKLFINNVDETIIVAL